ncbi:hypothetical protein EXIGLDRAFT_829479 [Exidia glandulosa HHB12029]|uniref:F-box domain-containing protein n=1 Tax=Exidia glandulosa HHB12029 TaxID=1314781 RepID=A0A165PK68_EXIGL|nr:hypothetical protein EXIGLDRAFT_829479 [Exidia glandulosa HHB12029]
MVALQDFPHELLVEISDNFFQEGDKTLLSLALTSRALSDAATEALYRVVMLNSDKQIFQFARLARGTRRVRGKPVLSLVRSLSCDTMFKQSTAGQVIDACPHLQALHTSCDILLDHCRQKARGFPTLFLFFGSAYWDDLRRPRSGVFARTTRLAILTMEEIALPHPEEAFCAANFPVLRSFCGSWSKEQPARRMLPLLKALLALPTVTSVLVLLRQEFDVLQEIQDDRLRIASDSYHWNYSEPGRVMMYHACNRMVNFWGAGVSVRELKPLGSLDKPPEVISSDEEMYWYLG